MKRIIFVFVTILALLVIVSCKSNEEKQDQLVEAGNTPQSCAHSTVVIDDIVLDNSYHQISYKLISYIGKEKFNEWIKKDNEEDLNIINFVHENNIPYEYLNQLLLTDPSVYYYYDYNLDAIYNGNEDYYTGDRTELILRRDYLLALKCGLNDLIKTSDRYPKWLNEKNNSDWEYCSNCGNFNGNIRQWSIPEVVTYFDISVEKLREINDRARKTVMYSCDLDMDLVFAYVSNNIDPSIIDNSCVRFDVKNLKDTIDLINDGYEIIP